MLCLMQQAATGHCRGWYAAAAVTLRKSFLSSIVVAAWQTPASVQIVRRSGGTGRAGSEQVPQENEQSNMCPPPTCGQAQVETAHLMETPDAPGETLLQARKPNTRQRARQDALAGQAPAREQDACTAQQRTDNGARVACMADRRATHGRCDAETEECVPRERHRLRYNRRGSGGAHASLPGQAAMQRTCC